LLTCTLICGSPLDAQNPASPPFRVARTDATLDVLNDKGAPILRYQLQRPADSKLSVDSACYIHPLATPAGVVLTDVAPDDHRHHRGVFLAWVEMHGRKDADFWGWGQHAPKDKRVIVNRSVTGQAGIAGAPDRISFDVVNAWEAEGDPQVIEKTRVTVRRDGPAHVADLLIALEADADLTLARWAFSGFCVRMRKDGALTASDPKGTLEEYGVPKHTDPKTDWPDAPWYDYTLKLDDGTVAGAAVINHPKNPPTLWHNHTGIRMLNPCIVAPSAVTLKAKTPLILRYRVVAHDGPADGGQLDRLAQEWSEQAAAPSRSDPTDLRVVTR
jgi:hypothetical protein